MNALLALFVVGVLGAVLYRARPPARPYKPQITIPPATRSGTVFELDGALFVRWREQGMRARKLEVRP